MERPTIGQKCTIKALVSKARYAAKPDEPKRLDRYPITTKAERHGAIMPFEAYYIGWRCWHEGVTRLEWDGDGEWSNFSYPVFKRTGSKVVWMFVTSERCNPVYAFPEDVEMTAPASVIALAESERQEAT